MRSRDTDPRSAREHRLELDGPVLDNDDAHEFVVRRLVLEDEQTIVGDHGHNFVQMLSAALIADPAGYSNVQIHFDVLAQCVVVARETVRNDSRQIRQVGR